MNVVIAFDADSSTGNVFSRDVDGRTLEFRISEDAGATDPLMVDRETGSEWLLLTGEAVDGPLKGLGWSNCPPTIHSGLPGMTGILPPDSSSGTPPPRQEARPSLTSSPFLLETRNFFKDFGTYYPYDLVHKTLGEVYPYANT